MKPSWISSALILSVSVMAAPVLDARQEKTKLEVKAQKGQKVTVSDTSSNIGKFKLTMDDQEQVMDLSEESTFEYTDTILEVDDAGRAIKVRRTVTKWREREKSVMDEEPQNRTMSLEGKTLTLIRTGEKTKIEGVEDVPKKERKKNRLRESIFEKSLPKEAVSVGTTWAVSEKGLLREFTEGMIEDDSNIKLVSAKGTGKLTSLSDGVATIVYDVVLKGTMQGGVTLDFKMKFTATLDVAGKRLNALVATGDVKFAGTMEQGGQKIKVGGGMKLKGNTKYQYASSSGR